MAVQRRVCRLLALLGESLPLHHSLVKPASARMADAQPYPECCSVLTSALSAPHIVTSQSVL